jgi:hypothetical protein
MILLRFWKRPYLEWKNNEFWERQLDYVKGILIVLKKL